MFWSFQGVRLTIDNHQLDMTTPLLETIMNWMVLIRGDVEEDVEKLLLVLVELGVEMVGVHLVRAALAREEFSAVVV